MVPALPQVARMVLPGEVPPDDVTVAGEAVVQALTQELASQEILTARSSDRFAASPVAFVIFAAVVFSFVFGLLVLTKLHPAQVLQIAGGTGVICVGAFFGRNALVAIGRRLITGPGKQ
jgi:hypothetical protein